MTSSTASAPVGYRQLVRQNRNFRYLWFGQIVSLLGDWFNLIASASLVAQLTSSGTAVGGLFVVRMLAPFLVSPIAGVVADRYNRKHVLVLTDVIRAVVVLGFLLVRESSLIWLLYTLTAIQLGVSGFFFPTRSAILPDLVSDDELGAANALSSATWSVMLALGAALGGLVAGVWGNQPAFVIDSLTFVASAFLLLRVRYRPEPGLAGSDRTVAAAVRQYVDGLRYLRRHEGILVTTLHKPAISLLVSSGFQVAQVAIAEQVFVIGNGGGISLGLTYAAMGVGTGVGPILARRITGDDPRRLRVAIGLGYVSATLGLLLVWPLSSFPLVLLGTLVRGFGSGLVWVFSTQLLLHLVPGQVRGRVFATEFAMQTLMSAVGAAVAGATLDAIGLQPLVLSMGLLALLPALLWAGWLRRKGGAQAAPAS